MSDLLTYGESHASAPYCIGAKNTETTFMQKRCDMLWAVCGFMLAVLELFTAALKLRLQQITHRKSGLPDGFTDCLGILLLSKNGSDRLRTRRVGCQIDSQIFIKGLLIITI